MPVTTLGIKVDDAQRERIHAAAQQIGRTPHWLVKQAALLAHTLKSSARSVGALSLGELCEQLETAGLAGDTSTCQALAARLDGISASSRAAILARDLHVG